MLFYELDEQDFNERLMTERKLHVQEVNMKKSLSMVEEELKVQKEKQNEQEDMAVKKEGKA